MAEWRGPQRRLFIRGFLGSMAGVTAAFLVIYLVGDDTDILLAWVVVLLQLAVLAAILYPVLCRVLGAHLVSRWDLDRDLVRGRLETAMRARGLEVAIQYEEPRVIFPVPPLSIVVIPGRNCTKVLVGPLTAESRDRVEGLKGFVERALAD